MKKKTILVLFLAFALMTVSSPAFADSREDQDPMNPKYQTRQSNRFYGEKKGLEATSGFKTKSPFTSSTYTHNSRFSSYSISHGVDVSYWQHTINWKKVKNDGISYAFLRAGYRTTASGSLESDSTYAGNIKNAKANGVKVGIYVFSQALTEKEATAEANFLIKKAKGYKMDLPLIMDYEYGGSRFRSGKISKKQATKNVNAFVKTVKAAGYTPMLYASTSFLNSQLNMSDINCKVWVAQYNWRNTYDGKYEYWQYSSSGKVSGISGKTDVNFRYYKPAAKTTVSTARLEWKKAEDAEGYIVYRYNPDTKEYEQIKDITDSETTSFTDRNLEPATVYRYTVKSYRTVVTSGGSSETVFTTVLDETVRVTLPEKTASLKVSSKTKTSITLKWTKSKNATGYEIYRYKPSTGKYKLIKRTASVSYKNTKLTKGLDYAYYVKPYKKHDGKYHYGAASSKITVKTKGTYLKKLKKKGKVRSSTLNVRKYAGTRYAKITSIKKKKKVKVTGYSKDLYRRKWYRVKFKKGRKTYRGYVYGGYVKLY